MKAGGGRRRQGLVHGFERGVRVISGNSLGLRTSEAYAPSPLYDQPS